MRPGSVSSTTHTKVLASFSADSVALVIVVRAACVKAQAAACHFLWSRLLVWVPFGLVSQPPSPVFQGLTLIWSSQKAADCGKACAKHSASSQVAPSSLLADEKTKAQYSEGIWQFIPGCLLQTALLTSGPEEAGNG